MGFRAYVGFWFHCSPNPSDGAELHVGSQLESVIRIMRRPLLVTPTRFKQPESAMLAFDGGATTRKGVEMLAASPLLKDCLSIW